MTGSTDPAAPEASALESPLLDTHRAAGASFTDFAGWQMPVRYSSDLAEHHAVRSAAGLFDLSHMAEFRVSGPDAAALLDHALAGRLSAIAEGQAKYSLLLAESGGIVDDVVVYRLGATEFLVVANASNHDPVAETLDERAAGFDARVADESAATALIAVQGPVSRQVLEQTAGLRVEGLDTLRYYRSAPGSFDGVDVLVARTGYTGEDGFELYLERAAAPALWTALLAAGEPLGLVPAGLASRDTLRLEAGMPLYGHELSLDTRPGQAGLGRVVDLGKSEFVGREALLADAPDAPDALDAPGGAPVLVGLVAEGKRAARAGYEVFASDDSAEAVGVVTSGALSPTLGHPIALAYVSPEFAAPGTELSVDIRGKRLAYRTAPHPFYRRKKD
ncbi:glycine cleavage system aminomethyltransferase GcvT [Herbiconiux sp. KACC 21604]|uniref:glycine cleavage system aminomethyltransferase GcvT n=1 Tax=unclassified Herbiconiux TaxID=2618217 RepID=UPI0014916B98|nr:glycine cleavage system aminomethyltransferase GcvT [Herbiconiux sp. SALV-R1]QJU53949.1 glycine cleavage system aminomethyltransferase GcvT [Herbiconiux sp. SALV-R1]WPO84976.1 glycine cleavage system aminomethyltransferase GcvT [Herbiconiux sp. KACC 21604]